MTIPAPEAFALRATSVAVTADTLTVELSDGRTLSVPVAWYPRLAHATAKERSTMRLIGGGEGIQWPLIEEDLSVEGLIAGRPSKETQESLQKWLTARRA